MNENEIKVIEPTLHISKGDVERHVDFDVGNDGILRITVYRWVPQTDSYRGAIEIRTSKIYKGPTMEGLTDATRTRFDWLLKMDYINRPDNIETYVTMGKTHLNAAFYVKGRLGDPE